MEDQTGSGLQSGRPAPHRAAGLAGRAFGLAWVLLGALGGWAQEEPPGSPEALVRLLETGGFDDRDYAAEALKALGTKARPALKKALENAPGLELREILEQLLKRIELARLVLQAWDRSGRPWAEAELKVAIQRSAFFWEAPPGEDQNGRRQLKTDAAGLAVLGELRPGQVLQFSADWGPLYAAPGFPMPGSVYLQGGDNPLRCLLVRGALLEGKLLTADGKPVEDARVILLEDRSGDWRLKDLGGPECAALLEAVLGSHLVPRNDQRLVVSSGKDGRFEFQQVPAGTYVLLAMHPDFLAADLPAVRLEWDGKLRLEAPLRMESKAQRAGVLRLKIRDAKGAPLKQVKLALDLQWVPALGEQALYHRLLRKKMSFQRWGMGEQQPTEQDTGEEGTVELKGVRPGTYRIEVEQANGPVTILREVQLKAGETQELEVQQAGEGGGLSGTVSFPEQTAGRWAQAYAVDEENPEAQALLREIHLNQWWLWRRFYRQGRQARGTAYISSDGRYEINRLAPGRYTLFLRYGSNQIGLFHGLEVKAGQKTQVPAFALQGPEGAEPPLLLEFQGKVTDEANLALPQGQLRIYFERNSSPFTQLFREGAFQFRQNSNQGKAVSMLVEAPGCRPSLVDLARIADPKNITVRLTRQVYGRALIRVQDPEGRPLQDVLVSPCPDQAGPLFESRGQAQGRRRSRATDPDGTTVFKGLAWGRRRFDLLREGYYQLEPFPLEVSPNQSASGLATLFPGQTLNGRIEAPKGADLDKVWLALRDSEAVWRAPSRRTGREFAFDGLPPGRYQLIAQAPGWVVSSWPTLELVHQQPPPTAVLRLLTPRRVQVRLGLEGASARVDLIPAGDWDPRAVEAEEGRRTAPQAGTSDAQGQVEFAEVAPGSYDLLVHPPGPDQELDPRTAHLTPVARVLGRVEVPLDERAPGDLQPLLVEKPFSRASGAAHGFLALQDEKILAGLPAAGQLRLYLLGTGCRGILSNYPIPQSFQKTPAQVLTQGKAPVEIIPPERPTAFAFQALPPGTYELWGRLDTYLPTPAAPAGKAMSGRAQAQPPGKELFRIGGFTLKEGEDLDLGAQTVQLPESLRAQILSNTRSNPLDNLVGPDKEDEVRH